MSNTSHSVARSWSGRRRGVARLAFLLLVAPAFLLMSSTAEPTRATPTYLVRLTPQDPPTNCHCHIQLISTVKRILPPVGLPLFNPMPIRTAGAAAIRGAFQLRGGASAGSGNVARQSEIDFTNCSINGALPGECAGQHPNCTSVKGCYVKLFMCTVSVSPAALPFWTPETALVNALNSNDPTSGWGHSFGDQRIVPGFPRTLRARGRGKRCPVLTFVMLKAGKSYMKLRFRCHACVI